MTMREIAAELDSGHMNQSTRRELFLCACAARDLLRYLRENTGDNADWPIEIRTDSEEHADAIVAKLESLERLTPK